MGKDTLEAGCGQKIDLEGAELWHYQRRRDSASHHFTIEHDTMTIEVNSKKRMNKIQKIITKRLRDKVTYLSTVTRPLQQMLEENDSMSVI